MKRVFQQPFMRNVQTTEWGLASRIGDTIYINRELLNEPTLLNRILLHEKNHTSSWGLHDLKMDITNKELKGHKLDFYKFIIKHPKTLTQLIPFWVYNKKIVIDPTLSLMWIFIILTCIALTSWIL